MTLPRLRIWPPLAIFFLFTLAVGGTGYWVYRTAARAARRNAEQALSAVADLKVRQVQDWLTERRANAERASRSPFMGPETEAWLARGAPSGDQTEERLISRLRGLRVTHHWDHVYLVDPRGDVKIDLSDGRPASPELRRAAIESITKREVIFRDIRHDPGAGPGATNFGFIAPLIVGDEKGERAVASIVMEMDPAQQLLALVESWPLPSRTGESLIVRQEGDSVLFINELRHRRGSRLNFRLRLDSPQLIAARAVRGEPGPMAGVDYRGVAVLACARKVAGSPWTLIAKVDMDEVNGPIVNVARLVAWFGFFLVLAAGLGTWIWLRQQRTAALVRHLDAERQRAVLTRHLDYLTRYANDIILLIDEAGRILDVNERAVSAYLLDRENLIGAHIRSLRAEESVRAFEGDWARARSQDGIVFQSVHRRGDGTTFPVEISSRAIEVDGVTLLQSIVRDITERKEAEQNIRKLSSLYNALSQMNKAIVRGRDRQGLFEEICRVAVEQGGLESASVSLVGESDGFLRVVAKCGREESSPHALQLWAEESVAEAEGPLGEALRLRRSYVCNDVFSDPLASRLRSSATPAGIRGIGAFPFISDGRAIGALSVFARETGFFDEQTVELLEEMAGDVSFALDDLAREERQRAAEEAFRESEEKYRLLFTNEQDAIHIFDPSTARILDANAAFAAMSGYSLEEVKSMRVDDFSGEPEATRSSIEKVRDVGSERVRQRRFRRKDGSEIWVEIDLSSFVWRGQPLVSAILRDVTERKRAEERLLLWTKVLENSAEAIIVTDSSAQILDVNKAFTDATGYAAEEVIGQNPRILASGRHDAAFYHVMWRTIRESGRWQGEIWNRRRNGEVYPSWLSITAVRDAAGDLTHYVGVSSDITERKESADRIRFLANHDSLTGLPNRSLMTDLIAQAVAIARRKGTFLALLFLDLDRFKTINDSLGHPAGDALLQQVAVRLKQGIREGDNVGRLGGDEFLILLPELTRSRDAAVVAEKLLRAMHEAIVIDGRRLTLSASIGISVYPDDGVDVSTLIRNADAALYHAKECGRNNYQYFTADMNMRAFEMLAMEMSLRGALERKEFALVYQPQVQTSTGRIIGAEALLRWHHPDLGTVSPGRFIRVAEEHGLIIPIGEWVLRAACAQVRSWLDEGVAVPVAVNVSAVQFRQSGLVSGIRAILDETGVDARYLDLELTESVIMQEAEHAVTVLEELSRMGVSLSIDDFGTGYSSLSYLRRFPLDRLKIDQSFVHEITTNPDAAAIAQAIIGMGKRLKLRVMAEGVETSEQLTFLAAQDCDELQGYYLGRPVDAGEFSQLLRVGTPLVDVAGLME